LQRCLPLAFFFSGTDSISGSLSISRGAQKLLQLARAEGIQATTKDIKEFLSSRTEEQQLKDSRNTKQSHGHIVSYNPFKRLQLDIY
jgi:hypothetical protein